MSRIGPLYASARFKAKMCEVSTRTGGTCRTARACHRRSKDPFSSSIGTTLDSAGIALAAQFSDRES